MTTPHCDSAQLAENLPAAEYVLCAMQWHRTLNYQGELFATPVEFATEFKGAYGYEAPYQAAQSAAAVEVFADASQSLDPRKSATRWPRPSSRLFTAR